MERSTCIPIIVVFVIGALVDAREPKCSEFDYMEKLLSKTIRMEVAFETLLNKVTEMENNVNVGLASLREDRGKLSKQLEATIKDQHERLNDSVKKMDTLMQDMKAKQDERLETLERNDILRNIGSTYTRWGRNVCPGNSTAIYSGYAAGSHHTHKGGPVETVCLPSDPQWSRFYAGQQSSYIYGTEYQGNSDAQFNALFGKPLTDHDMPCVVCKATGRPSMLMVPARTQCYSDWHTEYVGYLMSTHHSQVRASLLCVDSDPESIIGRNNSADENVMYFLEAAGQLPDPPYTRGKELACVVCTQ